MPGDVDGWAAAAAIRRLEAASAAPSGRRPSAGPSPSGAAAAPAAAAAATAAAATEPRRASADLPARPASAARSGGARSSAGSGGGAGAGVIIIACTSCDLDEAVPARSPAAAAATGGVSGTRPCRTPPLPPPLTVRQYTLACGVDMVVNKPIATAELRAILEGLLADRAARRVDAGFGPRAPRRSDAGFGPRAPRTPPLAALVLPPAATAAASAGPGLA
jgi:hypothetical protein